MAWTQLCIVLVLLVQFQVFGCFGCLEKEHIALLEIRASFHYSSKDASPPPWDDEKDCCDWEGVKCNNTTGRVKHLSLVQAWYQDYLNASWFLPFKELTSLDLSQNRLLGWVWNGGFERLSRLSKLEILDLDYNNFNNTILPSLSTISTLKNLSLGSNELKGSSHTQDLASLTNLEVLDLSVNYLDSFITIQGLRRMRKLQYLDLSHNNLGGSKVVKGLCELRSLQGLDISENKLTGILPSCLENLTSLRVLDRSFNQFVGNIALSPIANLTSLEYLKLSANNFQSPVLFSAFANHSKLKVFFLRCHHNNMAIETENPTRVPRFQLETLILSDCVVNSLTHAIPSFLYTQYDLRVVDFCHNNLKEEFPSWLLENNTNLEAIILRNNSFKGSLHLPNHPNMKRIDASQNHLYGQIPNNIGMLFPNLEHLNISANAFEGRIPSSFGDLTSLEILDLSNNNFSEQIPEHLVTGCSSLSFLKLSNNNLHGKIFPNFFNLTNLMALYLGGNHFSGKIPDSLSNCTKLVVLDVSDNMLLGSLHGWMGNMSHLQGIDMGKNHLGGPIPNDFCQLVSLKFLNLAENNLFGSIPSCLSPQYLEYVNFQGNRLTGAMAQALSKSSNLVTLNLGDNFLTGTIPNWIGKLPKLSILLMQGNLFQGSIPNDLCSLSGFSIMDLSHNSLSGPIPPCLNNITFASARDKNVNGEFNMGITLVPYLGGYIHRFHLSGHFYPVLDMQVQVEFTTKKRSDTYKGDILDFMSGIDLSCNQLTGHIPPEIGNLSRIHGLNLSHNHLTGPIPITFSNLLQVESLDLSYNNLMGKIPSQLTALTSLAVFSVACNNLSGRTPDRIRQFATFEESSYEGNPLLCGLPLKRNCSAKETTSGETRIRENDGPIDMMTFYVSFTTAYITFLLGIFVVFYINPYWHQLMFDRVKLCTISCYHFIINLL